MKRLLLLICLIGCAEAQRPPNPGMFYIGEKVRIGGTSIVGTVDYNGLSEIRVMYEDKTGTVHRDYFRRDFVKRVAQ